MKKPLIALGLTLLTACNSAPIDGLGEVEGRVTFMDADSVTFCAGLEMEVMDADCPNDYAFGEDTIVKFYQNGELVMLPPEAAAEQIMSSSNSDDYLFTFVLTDDTVLEMTQVEPVSNAKVMAPQPFYITEVTVVDSEQMITADPVIWLSSPDGCTTPGTTGEHDLPECNPNGFLIVNESSEDEMFYVIPKDTPVYAENLLPLLGMTNAEVGDGAEAEAISFEDLLAAFENNPEFFAGTPFELEYGTGMVDGQERSDMILAIKEIYIP